MMQVKGERLKVKIENWTLLVLLFIIHYSLFTVFTGCSKKSEQVLASVGGEKITVEEFERTLENAPFQLREYLSTDIGRRQYLDALVKEKIALVAAKKEGIQNRPAVRKQMAEQEKQIKEKYEQWKEKILTEEILKDKIVLGDSDVRNYYEKHIEEFEKPVEIRVCHILVSSEDEAVRILTRIKKNEDFSELAREHSIDKITAAKGGDLGFFGKREYVKEFEDAAFQLKKIGNVSDAVKTPLGYHIIKLTARKELKPQKLEDVELQIKQVLQKEKLDRWMDELSEKYKPKINYELLTKFVKEEKKNDEHGTDTKPNNRD